MGFERVITQIVRNTLYLRLLPIMTILLFVFFIFLLWKKRDFFLNLEFKREYWFFIGLALIVGLLLRIFANYIGIYPEYLYTAIANTIHETGKYGICIHQTYCFPSYKPYTLYPTILSFIHSLLGYVSFRAARILSISFGSLSILVGALFAKTYSDNLEAVFYSVLITIFPLHIIFSKSMETHATAIFFMFLSLVFLSESRGNINLFPLAVLSVILAILSKVYHLVLIFPLIFFIWKNKGEIHRKLNRAYIVFFVIVGLLLFPIYYNFLFIHDVATAQSLSLSPNLLEIMHILGQQPISIAIILISFIGLLLSIYKGKNFNIVFIIALYSFPIITHQKPTYRLWLSPLLLMLFFGSRFLSNLTRKTSDYFKVSTYKIISLILIVMFGLFFYTAPLRNHYYFDSEKALKKNMGKYVKMGDVCSVRADLLSSLTEYSIINLNFKYEKIKESENPIFFTSSECRSERFKEMIPLNLSKYELNKIEKVDEQYRFCIFSRKTT